MSNRNRGDRATGSVSSFLATLAPMDIKAKIDQLHADHTDTTARFRALLDACWEWAMIQQPEAATYTGFPGQNHRWADLSLAHIEETKRETKIQADALRAIPRAQLDEADQLTYDLVLRQFDEEIEGHPFGEELLAMGPMAGPQVSPANIIAMMPAATAANYEDILARLEGIPTFIEQCTDLLREGIARKIVQPRIVLEGIPAQLEAHATETMEEHPYFGAFARIPADIPNGDALKARATAIIKDKVAPAFRKLGAFTTDEYIPAATDSTARRDLPRGDEWYAYLIKKFTTTNATPQEIHDTGRSEVERIRAEMEELIDKAAPGKSFDEYTNFLRTDKRFYFDTAEELLAAYRDICKRADPELAKLFGTLPRLPYGVIPVPAHSEKTQTTAYYQPGAPDIGRAGYFFANTYDLASRPKWEMEALTLHEAVPGHHLQIALAQELPEAPEIRRWTFFTAYSEGWGLYSESLGEEMGFYTDPHSKFGQLSYEMWRAIRLVVDMGMHALGWSRDRSLDFFRANTGKPDHDITVEIDRYISWPGQATAYKTGELKLKELRARASAALGESFDIRAFHDAVLLQGALPLDVLERRIDDWIAASAP
jgi:uncharacterized protein (DUF885 family)